MGSESSITGAKNGSLYSAAKFGLRGLSQALREDCANRSVRVSIVNPGFVRTEFFKSLNFEPAIDKEAALDPKDVANVILNILASGSGGVIEEVLFGSSEKKYYFQIKSKAVKLGFVGMNEEMNVSMEIKSEWIESFKNVFGLCEIKKSEKVIILSESSSRRVNIEIAKIALGLLSIDYILIELKSKMNEGPLKVSTGASNALNGRDFTVNMLCETDVIIDSNP